MARDGPSATICPCVVFDVVNARAEAGVAPALSALIALARPKSSTFTVPSGVSLMFAGFKSRWMIPRSC
jgi:hypothetical protein